MICGSQVKLMIEENDDTFKGNVFVIEVVVIPKGYPRCIKIQVVMSFECCD